PQARVEPGRGVVPHERHRGRHGGGAAGALQHPTEAGRLLCRGLPWLVGRCPAGAGQRAGPRRLPGPQGSASRLARGHPPTRRRAVEIAAVLVNPIQSFHLNTPPPNDAVLLTSGARKAEDSSARYARWLRELRAVCETSDVPLIFDEVYTGFRLAPGGAQAH